jgi:hypothetical protein
MKLRSHSALFALSLSLLTPLARADDAAPPPTAKEIDDAWAAQRGNKKAERRFLLMERTSVFGIRATSLRVRGSDADGSTLGLTFAGSAEKYETWEDVTARTSSFFALGGGSGAVEGGLGADLSIGYRATLARHQGPLVRVGIGGELGGNSKLYFSRLELPQLQLGYQYVDGATVLELAARGGPILAGRYNTGDSGVRTLGASFEWGGYAAAHSRFGRVDLSMMRVEAESAPGTAVDIVRGSLCAYVASTIAICADGSFFRGDVVFPGAGAALTEVKESRSIYGGVLVGLLGW